MLGGLQSKGFLVDVQGMKGIVFAEFLDMVERHHGLEVVDAMLQAAAPASGGAYTAVGTYDWRELAQLAEALVGLRGGSVAEVLRDYGHNLFAVFAQRFPAFFQGVSSPLLFLAGVETLIHPEVLKLYPDAELPHFEVQLEANSLTLRYRSERPLGHFAQGLIEACLRHFGDTHELAADGAAGNWTFLVREREEVPCQSAR